MEFNATFLATIISFIVFVFLMNRILYAPVLNIMSERKAYINGNYKAAEENFQGQKNTRLPQMQELQKCAPPAEKAGQTQGLLPLLFAQI